MVIEIETKLIEAERRLHAVEVAKQRANELQNHIDQLLDELRTETEALRRKAAGDA